MYGHFYSHMFLLNVLVHPFTNLLATQSSSSQIVIIKLFFCRMIIKAGNDCSMKDIVVRFKTELLHTPRLLLVAFSSCFQKKCMGAFKYVISDLFWCSQYLKRWNLHQEDFCYLHTKKVKPMDDPLNYKNENKFCALKSPLCSKTFINYYLFQIKKGPNETFIAI